MAKATWNGATIAESDETIRIEGNHYFPPASVSMEYLTPSSQHTICPWKGEASYYDLTVNGETNDAAAWYYPMPKDGATERVGQNFSNYVAFWHGVEVED